MTPANNGPIASPPARTRSVIQIPVPKAVGTPTPPPFAAELGAGTTTELEKVVGAGGGTVGLLLE